MMCLLSAGAGTSSSGSTVSSATSAAFSFKSVESGKNSNSKDKNYCIIPRLTPCCRVENCLYTSILLSKDLFKYFLYLSSNSDFFSFKSVESCENSNQRRKSLCNTKIDRIAIE